MKQSLKQILLTLSLTFYSSAHGMDLQQNITWVVEGGSYAIGKYFVMLAQAIRLQFTLFAYQVSPRARTLGVQMATNQLKVIEKNLIHAEQKAIKNIFVEFKIEDELQSEIRSLISDSKEQAMNYYQSPREDAIHDPNFPSDIFPILKNSNIDPLSVNLQLDVVDKDFDGRASVQLMYSENEGKKMLIYSHCPTITLFTQRYFTLPTQGQKATLIHEVEHLRSTHGITCYTIKKVVSHLANKPASEMENSTHYQKLKIILERQAEVFPATRSAQDAEIFAVSQYLTYYPGHLHLGHLQQLTEIKNLHHCIARLKNHHSLPIRKLPDFKMKFNIPKSSL